QEGRRCQGQGQGRGSEVAARRGRGDRDGQGQARVRRRSARQGRDRGAARRGARRRQHDRARGTARCEGGNAMRLRTLRRAWPGPRGRGSLLLVALAVALAGIALDGAPAVAQIPAALGKPLPSPDLPAGTVVVRIVAGSAASPVVGTEVTLLVNGTPR